MNESRKVLLEICAAGIAFFLSIFLMATMMLFMDVKQLFANVNFIDAIVFALVVSSTILIHLIHVYRKFNY